MEHNDRPVPPFIGHRTTSMVIVQPASRPIHWSLLLGAALAITLYLYYIDEGRYSLEGLMTPGNLFAMGLYFLGMVAGLFTVSALVARRRPGVGRTTFVLVFGSVLGFVFGLLLILGLGLLAML